MAKNQERLREIQTSEQNAWQGGLVSGFRFYACIGRDVSASEPSRNGDPAVCAPPPRPLPGDGQDDAWAGGRIVQ